MSLRAHRNTSLASQQHAGRRFDRNNWATAGIRAICGCVGAVLPLFEVFRYLCQRLVVGSFHFMLLRQLGELFLYADKGFRQAR
ncbi:conserved hypothetical protein [Ricinus communis]|uniref:Uncharacterized protein n=1 Tax=Ricinus communis TaxID=3988 RepID=B9TCN3_RICCO|nr:conserved hypothetical protein [Ricinus communis]